MAEKPKRFSRLRLAYLLLFAAFFGSWAIAQFGNDQNWFVAMAGTGVAGIVWPPAVLLAVVLAVKKRWLDAGVVFVSLAAYLLVSGQLVWTPLAVSAKDRPSLRVMSFNVEHCWVSAERVAETVKSENVDAFCFQELGIGDDAKAVDELKTRLPDYTFLTDGSRTSGTRLPVLRQGSIPLNRSKWGWTMIEQVVDFHGRPIRILNVHAPSYQPGATRRRPFFDWFRRWGELAQEQRRLIDIELQDVASESTPTVLCGDFNMAPIGTRYRALKERATDAFAAAGSGTGWTRPAGLPVRRIDYIWAFPGLKPLESHVVDHQASDHAAVVATLALK